MSGAATSSTARSWSRSRLRRDAGSISVPAADFPAWCSPSCSRSALAASIDLVESNRKKASFLQAVDRRSSTCRPGRHAARIEDSYGRLFRDRKSSRRGRWRRLPALLDLAAAWLTGAPAGCFTKAGITGANARKRSPLGLRSGRTSEHDRPAWRRSRIGNLASSADLHCRRSTIANEDWHRP